MDSGEGLGGKVVDGTPYLILGYSGDSWLFMQRAKFRFDGNDKVFTLTMNSPNQEVGSTARVYETQSMKCTNWNLVSTLDSFSTPAKSIS